MDLDELLVECIEKICAIPADQITPETRLEDLGADSLAVAEIIVEMEVRLDRELPIHFLRQLDTVRTVGDVATELRVALAEPAGEPGP